MILETDNGWSFIEPLDDGTVDHDREYWTGASLELKLAASWDMTVIHHFMTGGTPDGLRMDKTRYWIGPIEVGQALDFK